jgi:hypothetical protein
MAWAFGVPNHVLIKLGNTGIAVEGFVANQRTELDTGNKRRNADGVEAMARQQVDPIGDGEILGASGAWFACNRIAVHLLPPGATIGDAKSAGPHCGPAMRLPGDSQVVFNRGRAGRGPGRILGLFAVVP